MKFFNQLDNGLINAHQWVLDKTQVEPATAVKWCWRGVAMLTVVKCALEASEGPLTAGGYVVIAMALLSGAVSYRWLIQWPKLMHEAFPFIRMMLVVLLCIPLGSITPYHIAAWFCAAILTSGMYFAVCDKPKPPHRKAQNKLAMQ